MYVLKVKAFLCTSSRTGESGDEVSLTPELFSQLRMSNGGLAQSKIVYLVLFCDSLLLGCDLY